MFVVLCPIHQVWCKLEDFGEKNQMIFSKRNLCFSLSCALLTNPPLTSTGKSLVDCCMLLLVCEFVFLSYCVQFYFLTLMISNVFSSTIQTQLLTLRNQKNVFAIVA